MSADVEQLVARLEVLVAKIEALGLRRAGKRAVTLKRLAIVRAAFPNRAFSADNLQILFGISRDAAHQWAYQRVLDGDLERTTKRGLYRLAEVKP